MKISKTTSLEELFTEVDKFVQMDINFGRFVCVEGERVSLNKIVLQMKKICAKQSGSNFENMFFDKLCEKIYILHEKGNEQLKESKLKKFGTQLARIRHLFFGNVKKGIVCRELSKRSEGISTLKNELFNTSALTLKGKTEEERVLHFASKLINIAKNNLKLSSTLPGLFSGASGSPTYCIYDKQSEKLLAVVKLNDKNLVIKEMESLQLMQKINSDNCKAPSVLGFGKSKLHPQKLYYAQSPAPGISLDKLFAQVAHLESTSDREKNFLKLKSSMVSCAKTLSTLHNYRPPLPDEEKRLLKDEQNIMCEAYKGSLRRRNNEIIEKFGSDIAEKIKEIIKSVEFDFDKCCYVHGDVHPGNIFYDDRQTNPITLIDFDMFFDSVDPYTKGGTGRALYDVVYFKLWIAVTGAQNDFSLEEINELQTEFLDSYFNDMHQEKDSMNKEMQLMQIYISLHYIDLLKGVKTKVGNNFASALSPELIDHLIDFLTAQVRKAVE